MKVVSRLFAALLVAGLLVPLLSSPAMAAVDINSMSIKPSSSGTVGSEVYLTGEADDDDNGYVYFEIDPDDEEWEQVLSNSSGNWDWDSYDVTSGSSTYTVYEYQTDPFEIPECVGGTHRIAIVTKSLGSTTDYDDVYDFRAGTSAIKSFTVVPAITIKGDDEGPAGTEVELSGTGFGYREEITIYFDGAEAESVGTIKANDVGTWTGKFIVPPSSQGSHDITAGGDDTDEDDVEEATFTVEPGITITPTSGKVGSEVKVSLSGFKSNESSIEILFAGKTVKTGLKADADGAYVVTVVVPAAPMGKQEFGARGQSTTLASVDKREFTVEPSLVVEPLSGAAGTEIEVKGVGLPASTAVTVTYDGVTKGTGTTSSDGTLAGVTFSATHTQTTHTTDHPVAAMFDSTTLTETFVMESTAPGKPVPRTPVSGTRIGFLGKQTPTLTWSVVDDPSGVSYALQISTTSDFSQILISKSNLVAQGSAIIVSSAGTEMTYTLSDAEALPFGTYYWRVKAVDGAMNDSGWSASNTFKAGLLPTWALIVIIVLAAVLIGALIYVLVIRDRVGLYD